MRCGSTLHEQTQLRIPTAAHGAVIDIGAADDSREIIDNDKFAVEVDDLRGGSAHEHPVCSETQEDEVVVWVGSCSLES